MSDTPNNPRQSSALILLTIAFSLLIVIGPFLLVRKAQQESDAAEEIVIHTHQVEATVHELMYQLRNRESAVLAYGFGHDTANIRERMEEGERLTGPTLQRLAELTRDNPEQQVRIGRLTSIVEQRRQIADGILAKPAGELSKDDAEWLLERNPLRFLNSEIIDTERALLAERKSASDQLQRRADLMVWAAITLQLLLLGALGLVLRRLWLSQRDAETRAKTSSIRAQAVLQTVREPVAVVDRELKVLLHNPAFAEVFAGKDAGIGSPIDAFGATWNEPDIRQRLADVLGRNRELWDYEIVHRSEDGSERNLLVNARRMTLPDHLDEVALVSANDVTTQKVAEQRVRDLNRQLQGKIDQVSEVNRELEAFSYSVSHDLRAPLRHIGGFAEKLGRHLGERNDDKTVHYIGIITTSAKRMSRLIDDLLVYSRLGRSALRLQPVDMQSLVDETRAMLDANNSNERPDHRIEWRIAPLPILVGDENMLRQVWLNLLSNAVKYSAGSEPAMVEVGYRRLDNGDCEFTVADNGVGFDMAYAGKLFGVFQRLHSVGEFEGTGIGLASVRRVLSRHGGHIRAESEPGKGARFIFTLPATSDNAPLDKQA